MTLHVYPYVYLTVRAALERMDSSLEEAAAVSGAGRGRVTRDITLRLVMPASPPERCWCSSTASRNSAFRR